jgi:ubiquinol-cytochrome c reductase cytochrome c subunit
VRVLFSFLALVAMTSAALAAEEGNAQNGKQLFEAKGCYSCHGYVGQGSREGPRLVPVIALPAFEAQLRTPRQIMPPYVESVVSDREVADIHAYLANLPKPPDPKTIELLR